MIRIRQEYMISYNCKLFVLRKITGSYNYLLSIIISHLKPNNCMQTIPGRVIPKTQKWYLVRP